MNGSTSILLSSDRTANGTDAVLSSLETAAASIKQDDRDPTHMAILGLIMALFAKFALTFSDSSKKAPYVGFRSVFEPAWLVRLRFARGAIPMINEGYEKFKNSMYRVCRNDKDLLVISNKYVDELRNLPRDKLSSIQALVINMIGKYSGIDIMLRGDLSTRMLQSKLTPNLAIFTTDMKDELNYGLSKDMPECEGCWVEVDIYKVLLHIIARISNRVFVGIEACRNKDWLEASIRYPENVSMAMMIMKSFPSWTHPVVAWFLPCVWRINRYIRLGQKALTPYIEARMEAEKNPDYKKPFDLLQWMMD
ncbi:hypothetical protein GJ744_011294 [Endocarpon pusillum]|uniref:Uncharacterized protein n=1 Tax=Endocarpon pusillum TaxID=364733 RepID=A0A8H7E9B8_9EURO|nr:hypothetical protein GJ744_011294 [Endocarpon pusillum]